MISDDELMGEKEEQIDDNSTELAQNDEQVSDDPDTPSDTDTKTSDTDTTSTIENETETNEDQDFEPNTDSEDSSSPVDETPEEDLIEEPIFVTKDTKLMLSDILKMCVASSGIKAGWMEGKKQGITRVYGNDADAMQDEDYFFPSMKVASIKLCNDYIDTRTD